MSHYPQWDTLIRHEKTSRFAGKHTDILFTNNSLFEFKKNETILNVSY